LLACVHLFFENVEIIDIESNDTISILSRTLS